MMWRVTKYAVAFAAGQAFQIVAQANRDLYLIREADAYFRQKIRERQDK